MPQAHSAKEPPHTLAIELEPLDSKISETRRIVLSCSCTLECKARLAKLPCPSSLRPTEPIILASPTLKLGKL